MNPFPSDQADLLDRPVVGAPDIAAVEDAVAALLATTSDVVLVQGEAVVALEATAKSLAHKGSRALNVVTGPYGALFGRWLAAGGSQVVGLDVPYHRSVTAVEVENVLATGVFDLVAVVHAEAATGGANPMDDIADVVATHGAMLVVDAVASVGAHPVTPDRWRADVVVVGGQKALAGPAGVSALSISPRAWDAMERNASAPRESMLSLLDIRDGWLRAGRSAVLGTPASLETAALGQALARVSDEGLDQVIRRHLAAAQATRAGLVGLGLAPWIADDEYAAAVVTTIAVPDGWSVVDLVAAARVAGSRLIGPAPGVLSRSTFRINHTGRNADVDLVCGELAALGSALGLPPQDTVDAVATARRVWAAS